MGLLIVVLAMAYYLYQVDSGTATNQQLLPEINTDKSVIAAIDRVLITQKSESLDMHKSVTGWLLNDGFYVDMDTLFSWIQALKNAQLIELKTTNPDHYSELQLTDDDLRVRLYHDDVLLTDLVLGINGVILNSRFARRFNEHQTVLATHLNSLTDLSDNWQLKTLFDYTPHQVHAIKMTSKDGSILNLLKNNETGQWQFENKFDGHINTAKVDDLASGLAQFTIKRAEPIAIDESAFLRRLEFGLSEGHSVELNIYKSTENKWVTVTDSQQPGRFENWQFAVPDFKIKTLTVTKSQLLQSTVVAPMTVKTPLTPATMSELN